MLVKKTPSLSWQAWKRELTHGRRRIASARGMGYADSITNKEVRFAKTHYNRDSPAFAICGFGRGR